MNLYEIDARITALVDPETGEITDLAKLEELSMARDTKIENVACWYKNLAAEAKAIRDEEISLAERRHSAERKADSLKRYLSAALNGEKFQSPKCAVTFRRTTSVKVEDADALIEWAEKNARRDYLKYSAPEPDKAKLGQSLKLGIEIPGVELSENLFVGVK
ncbi:siphovirus Gp157 family protein [Oscillibacter sp.]|uniref:siphovirus Gp157 family protein n=1 Tax=Oscillibacter sp. TaxID=1945593 RepID=UPI0028A0C0D4|nr:siphovirus Gp157 family protein [Oscillibacter sp.]